MSFLRSLLSLEALDLRLIPDSQEHIIQNKKNASRSRWKTKEFYLYYIVFLTVVPQMFLAAMRATNENSSNYSRYEDRLEQGWMFGRKVDNSDAQYSGFRGRLPILTVVVICHYALRRLSIALKLPGMRFDLLFAGIFLGVLYGFNILKILAIYTINFLISKSLPKREGMILTWIFGIGILFLNEWYEGYKFKWLSNNLAILDQYCGLLTRWEVNFNFSMLRMISYNSDFYDSLETKSDIEKKQLDEKIITEKDRINLPPPKKFFSYFTYLAYLTYSPLFIAGPIISFNDYVYQRNHPLRSVSIQRTIIYGIRVVLCILVMEWCLHYMYVVAITEARAWEGLSPFEVMMVGYFNLTIIWLKLLIPWRFFRFWALLDKIDPPENMLRCMSDNYSASAFWRAWHRSFHRWVIKYLYVPLEGAKHPIRNMLLIFTFVAFWHDIQLRLLAWGWLITLFVIPEVVAKLIFPAKKWASKPIYRHMCAIGAVANIYLMMIANLVGFALGLDGVKDMIKDIFKTIWGIPYVLFASVCLFVGVQVMFEVRASEGRQGINLRC
ncbi:MBOAT, membrane-bound O-acyltransferase family-domain-containing protein [Dipodascopsis uninucleata]